MQPTRRFANRAVKKAVVKTGDAQGASGAIFVATLSGEEYLVKARTLCAAVGPFIPANELIAIELAEHLRIPVLGWDFVELQDGDVGFGLRRMKNAEFGRLNSKMLGLLAEPDLLSAIAVFDLWIVNTDRHNGNLLCRKLPRGGKHQVLATDHSHALIREHTDPAGLDAFAAAAPHQSFFHSDELRESVHDCAALRETIDIIHDDSTRAIDDALTLVPEAWMDGDVKQKVRELLVGRAATIEELFNQVAHVFPRLPGGVL